MSELFRTDVKLTQVLAKSDFTLSTEVIPPRNGASSTTIMKQIESLCEAGSAFLSVTKGAGGSLRAGSLPIAQAIKDRFSKPSIAHFTCRDLSPAEVENQLMDHHYFGIRNILALRGDPPRGLPDWKPNEDSYPYAYQLMNQIRHLNEGRFLERADYQVNPQIKTDFCIGAACYPDEPNYEARIGHFKRKAEAGAEFAISQMLFDVDSYSRFIEDCHKENIDVPVLPGTRILKSKEQALRMGQRFEANISKSLLAELPSETEPFHAEACVETFARLIESFKKAGAPGVHLFVLQDTELSSMLLKHLEEGGVHNTRSQQEARSAARF